MSSEEMPETNDPMAPARVDSTNAQRGLYYANYAQCSLTLFDIKLILSYIIGQRKETGELVAENIMEVPMSPEFAKTVHMHLTVALERYEKVFGPLRLKPEHMQVRG